MPSLQKTSYLSLNSSANLNVSYFSNKDIAFEFDKLPEAQRPDLVRCALDLMETGDFEALLLPCLGEVVDKHLSLMSRSLRLTVAERLRRSPMENKTEIKRLVDKCLSY